MNADRPSRTFLSPMSNSLIDIGIGVFHGSGQEASQEQAVQQLVARALEPIKSGSLPARFALLLATADWCHSEISLPRQVRSVLKEQLGHDVPLLGGSSSQLYVSTEPEASRFIKNGMWLVVFCSEDVWLTVTSLERPHAAAPKERRRNVTRITKSLEETAGSRLGTSANRFLFGFLPGVMTGEDGRRVYYDHELHQDILTALNHRHLFFGASTTDHADPTVGYQFANDECLKSGLALGFLESDLCIGAAMSHGFGKSNAPRVSVDGLADADQDGGGYNLTRLDGKPAAQRIKELKDDGWIKFDRPVFGLPQGYDFNIHWPLETVSEIDASIQLKRKVTLGDRLYLLDASPEDMLETAAQTVDKAIEKSSASQLDDLGLLICFLCGGRSRQFELRQVNWKDTVEKVRRKYPNIPIVGAMAAGEFGVDEEHEGRANNMGVSVICTANAYQRRAQIRTLQRKLVSAASNLLTHQSPKGVMEEALRGAINAGATGGKINIVDRTLGRILGMDFGVVLSPPDSPHNWEAVTKHTDYPMPDGRGGDFPIALRANSMAVVPGLPFPIRFVDAPTKSVDGKWDNILQLVVRTLHAVFIPDWLEHERDGLCNIKARAEGNLISELVVPLVGSQFNVVATLQLSFPDNSPLDRESLAVWVSYTQKVAAALERAGEAELRKQLEQITELGNQILNTPLSNYQTQYDWCEEYFSRATKLLGANGGNIRTREPGTEPGEGEIYRLRASVGIVEDILPKSRPVVGEDDSGLHRDLIEAGASFVNREEEVANLLVNLKAVKDEKRYSEELTRTFKPVKAMAILPLTDQSERLGLIYFYSTKQYFFTERCQKIATAIAELGGAILRAKKAEYDREYLNQQMEHLEGLLTLATEDTAVERLQRILERVCASTGADVGSIFTWHDTPKNLILHACNNWHEPLVGEAQYFDGEGWTGGLIQEEWEIVYVTSPADTDSHKRKYYEEMIAPEHRSQKRESRIGVRLSAGKKLLGVMTLVYYREHTNRLSDRLDFIKAFLERARRYITLGLELAKREAREERTRRFFGTKERVYNYLIHESGHSQALWQMALNTWRSHFEIECLTLYQVQGKKLVKVFSSQLEGISRPDELPLLLDGPLKNVVFDWETVCTSDPSELKQWPSGQNIKSLIAVPLVTSKGETWGVLEFVNRLKTSAHPFASFDRLEKNMANDVAHPLVLSLESQENENLRTQLASATKIGAKFLSSAIVMHQVMSPFANMRGVIDWLLLHPDSPPDERAQYLRQIERFYTQALETIRQAGRRGTLGLRREKLRTLVHQAVRFIEPKIPVAGVKVKITNNLPVEVNVDPMSVVGALVNLLSNAIEAMNGSGTLTVSTDLSPDRQAAIIRIHNSSAPLTETDMALFFQPGVSTKSDEEHLGLGIPMAKQAVEAAGGTLRLNPTTDGVEAIVLIPLADTQRSKSQEV
ncbi:MAG: FIST N-terminal domain-containing protein [Blastocatellales bacterium]